MVKQLCQQFKIYLKNEVNKKKDVLYIQPMQKMNKEFLENLHKICSAYFFGMKVKLLPVKKVEGMEVRHRINPLTDKIQYNARDIIQQARK